MHLKNHVIELLENRNFICDVCEKNFKTKSNLLYHKAEVHAKEKIKCEICSKTYGNHESINNPNMINEYRINCNFLSVLCLQIF